MSINPGQEFITGGYTVGGVTFDALIFGYYAGKDLICGPRQTGFCRAAGRLHEEVQLLETAKCPFTNLPELTTIGSWMWRRLLCEHGIGASLCFEGVLAVVPLDL
jgi:hypothetical protein